eukprot:11789727-Prorocentrum_lima.AAC.1
MMKPWTIKTDCKTLGDGLLRHCDRQHVHAQCSGVDCKSTESYTDDMARRIHASFRKHCEQVVDIHRTRAHNGPIVVVVCAQVVF